MNDKHHGPHCAGSCEGAAYSSEIQRLRADNEALREACTLPKGWHVETRMGAAKIVAPDGSGAWYGVDGLRNRLVCELVAALVAAHDRGEK